MSIDKPEIEKAGMKSRRYS